MRGGGDAAAALHRSAASRSDGTARGSSASVVRAADVKELQALGDALREQLGSGVGVLAASFEDGKGALLVVVTDDLREQRRARGRDRARTWRRWRAGAAAESRTWRRRAFPTRRDSATRCRARLRSFAVRWASVVTLGEWLRERNAGAAAAARGATSTKCSGERGDAERRWRCGALPRRRRGVAGRAGGAPSAGRESALDLLTVDALVTYAFEAAAEAPASLEATATAAMTLAATARRERSSRRAAVEPISQLETTS